MRIANSVRGDAEVSAHYAKPNINVTPLIDVLLVVLIIFMVVSPTKPARFQIKVPTHPDPDVVLPNIDTLVVTINPDRSLKLNSLDDMGSVNDTSKLSAMLVDVFQRRLKNHAYGDQFRDRNDLPEEMRIEKTVFIKAPRSLPYADVVRVLDGIKGAGASPVGLQIDNLN
ncbi:MAG: biopolymer transport protein TolR [Blastocatellia bacterium]|jgi:biopolymer transport protein ExbD|nr:biopolymer transport protein TolR [Blastocatellia bacterium]